MVKKKATNLLEELTDEEQSYLELVLVGINESTESEFDETEIETAASDLVKAHGTRRKAEKALEKSVKEHLVMAAEALRPHARPTARILAVMDAINAEDDSDDDEDSDDD